MTGDIEPVIGRYLHLDYAGKHYRIYFESAGEGIPLVCLHTAGADTRQYRGLFDAPGLPSGFGSSPSTCRFTASRRRPPAGRTRNTG